MERAQFAGYNSHRLACRKSTADSLRLVEGLMIKPSAMSCLRAAAELRQALVARDAVRKCASSAGPAGVAARLQANHGVHMAALQLAEAIRGKR